MAFEFQRNIADADLTVTRALTAADGSVTCTDFDLGTNSKGFAPENVELEIAIPSLTGSELASADTLITLVQGGAAASPTTSLGMTKTLTGTGSTLAATTYRFRLPPDCPRYVNVKFTTAGTSGDMSAKSATVRILT